MKYVQAITANGVEYIDLILFEDVVISDDNDTPEWSIDAGTD